MPKNTPPPTPPATPEDIKRARLRAKEWRQFRCDYLFSQRNLADALGCSRRTIVAVEGGREVINPHAELLRRFRDLKRQQEKAAEQHDWAVA